MLANFTNDAWWGKSIAAQQHLQIAQMRAAETARPMLRSTNTGMTAVIDWRGRIKAEAIPFKTQILEGSIKGRTGLTPYARLGNYSVFLLSFSILLACSGFRDSIDLA